MRFNKVFFVVYTIWFLDGCSGCFCGNIQNYFVLDCKQSRRKNRKILYYIYRSKKQKLTLKTFFHNNPSSCLWRGDHRTIQNWVHAENWLCRSKQSCSVQETLFTSGAIGFMHGKDISFQTLRSIIFPCLCNNSHPFWVNRGTQLSALPSARQLHVLWKRDFYRWRKQRQAFWCLVFLV